MEAAATIVVPTLSEVEKTYGPYLTVSDALSTRFISNALNDRVL